MSSIIKKTRIFFLMIQIVNKVNKMIGFNKRSGSRHAEIEQRSLLELQVSSGDFGSNEEIGRLLTASLVARRLHHMQILK